MRWTLEREYALREYLAIGLNQKEIAERLGVSERSVHGKLIHIRRGRATSPALKERIIKLWLDGYTYNQISLELDINRSVVRWIILSNGLAKAPVKKRSKQKRWQPHHDEELKRLHAKGLSFNVIAKHMGFCDYTVSCHATRLGLPSNYTSIWTKAKVLQLRQLVTKGLSTRQIAKQLGVSRGAVIGKLNRLGIKTGRRVKITSPKINPDGICDLAPEYRDGAVPFLELKDNQCPWPLWGSGLSMHCCGKKLPRGARYCDEHNKRTAQ